MGTQGIMVETPFKCSVKIFLTRLSIFLLVLLTGFPIVIVIVSIVIASRLEGGVNNYVRKDDL